MRSYTLFRKCEHPFSKSRELTACTSCSFPLSSSSVMGDLRAYSRFTRLIALNLGGSGERASALGE